MGKDTDPNTGKDTNQARRARMAKRKEKREKAKRPHGMEKVNVRQAYADVKKKKRQLKDAESYE